MRAHSPTVHRPLRRSRRFDALNNAPAGTATDRSILGPFSTDDVPDGRFNLAPSPSLQFYFYLTCAVTSIALGESIASEENNGEYLYVAGRMLTSRVEPIPGAVTETWESWEWTTRATRTHIALNALHRTAQQAEDEQTIGGWTVLFVARDMCWRSSVILPKSRAPWLRSFHHRNNTTSARITYT